jgi:hypothetical protein
MDEKYLDMRVKLDFARDQTVKMENKTVKECQNMRFQVHTMNQTINKLSSALDNKVNVSSSSIKFNATTFAKNKGLSDLQSTSKSIDSNAVLNNNNNNTDITSHSMSIDRPHSANNAARHNNKNKKNRPSTAGANHQRGGELEVNTDRNDPHNIPSNSSRNSSAVPSPKLSSSPTTIDSRNLNNSKSYNNIAQSKEPLDKILAKIEAKTKPDQSIEKAVLLAFRND